MVTIKRKKRFLFIVIGVLILVGSILFFCRFSSKYPIHKNITATVFWIGEPVGNGSSEDNTLSAWDDEWQKNYGGYDDYVNRNGYYP
ncbi:MAG: hypothetical protein H0U27_12410, partial [Nitrosopumilus sp.]|nr:hypothetical protein [Nitrosopumilus sp.]